ncbi:MAG TPA: outer membrane protein assembly factor BamA [Steroidobacteraceae bacterium]|nr:outer membrane protein assembly factor BamA [Steroidobacteraceae bacterium]
MNTNGRGAPWRRLTWILLAGAGMARAQEPAASEDGAFTVTGIRVEGLQRITEGTLFNTLPVNVGDRLDAQRVREALRAVCAMGFFRDVEMRREEEGVLVVVVQESPSIRSFSVKGNKDIKTEDLNKSLRNVGLAQGKILSRSTLEDVRQFLTEQYYAHGRYNVVIDVDVDDIGGNLVDVKIDITEGKRSRIRSINVVGNQRFDDKELLGDLELKKTNLLSFYRSDDQYSKQSLEGDLEKLRSHYMDRGYADFEITSTQVALAPEKDDLFVTINVYEGETWKTGAVKLAGRFVVPEEILRQYVLVRPGQTWSQRLIAASEEALRNRLGEAGFSFADVAAVPTANADTHEIALTFQIEPNMRTYVRRIAFNGIGKTNDEVLRREMRQLEGGTLSNAALERSEQRLQRLPYIEKAEYETRRVPGSDDLVDVEFDVTEGPSSTLSGGIGYSERQAFTLQGNYIDSNLFGSGNRLAMEFNGGRYGQVYSISHTDPYFTVNGVSRSISASYIERERLTSSFSQFSTSTYSTGLGIGYPISEDQYVNFGLTYSHEDLSTVLSSSTQLRDWVRNNGDDYFRRVGRDPVLGTILDTLELSASWSFDSRDRYLFPTRGGMYRFTGTVTPPGGSVEFATANWRSQQFFRLPLPLIDKIPFSFATNLGWGTALGDTTALPPNRHIFTGGSDSVRGFEDGTLGPRDSLGNPYGGDAGISAQLEAIIPIGGKFASSARLSLFLDAGQSFYLGDTKFRNKRGDRVEYRFDLSELRVSTGIAVQWLSPMGLLRFSYAYPLKYQDETRRLFGDETQEFQFSVGKAF